MLTIPMFLFFAICGSRDRRMRAFNYFFWYTVFGSVPFLIGILYLKSLTNSTDYTVLSNYLFTPQEQIIIWMLLAPAIIFKVPLCPFHLWLPEAHVEASTNVSIFLAGILLKIGGYAYIRFLIGFVPLGNLYFLDFINMIAILSSCWPAFSALWQTDLKRIIAYMSVAHMAVAILSLNTYTVAGFYSSLYNFISHGVIASALFLLVGILYENYKTRHIWYYSGLFTTMPLFGLYFLFFVFCNIGFPGSSAFVAELTAFISLAQVSLFLLFFVLFGAFLLVVANLWLVHVLFGAPNTVYIKHYKDIEFWSGDHFALMILAIVLVFMGVFPEQFFIMFENLFEYYFFRFTNY
jgi:NADH:ubiquinone oxidoreductase subunit 4 (subunit M)